MNDKKYIQGLQSSIRYEIEHSFNALYDQYNFIYYIIFQMVREKQASLELTDDTFYSFFNHIVKT